MTLFSDWNIFHPAFGRCEQSHHHANVFNVFLCVPNFYVFMWIFIDTSRLNMQSTMCNMKHIHLCNWK